MNFQRIICQLENQGNILAKSRSAKQKNGGRVAQMIFGNKIGSNIDLSRECSNSPIEEEVDLKESFGYKPEGRRASRMGFKVPN